MIFWGEKRPKLDRAHIFGLLRSHKNNKMQQNSFYIYKKLSFLVLETFYGYIYNLWSEKSYTIVEKKHRAKILK